MAEEIDKLELGERVAAMLGHEARLGPVTMLWATDQVLRIIGRR